MNKKNPIEKLNKCFPSVLKNIGIKAFDTARYYDGLVGLSSGSKNDSPSQTSFRKVGLIKNINIRLVEF